MFMRLLLALFLYVNTFVSAMAEDFNLDATVKKVKSLEHASWSISPELKNVRSFRAQKGAESWTRTADFLPKAYFSLKKEKDFFEERNETLRRLGFVLDDSTWQIDYNWTLFNYGLVQNTKRSYAEKNKAELELDSKEKEYPITFTTNLLNYLLAKYKKEAVENSLKKAETGKREAKLGFELGQKTKLDVLRAEANLVSLDSKKTSYSDEEQNTKSRFLEYSGMKDADIVFLNNLSEENILTLINALSTPSLKRDEPDFSRSPLIQNLEYEEKINRLNLARLTQAQWPELKLQGSYTNSADTFAHSFHNPTRAHTLALVLTIPFFGGGDLASSWFENLHAGNQIEATIRLRKLETENQLNNTFIKIRALEKLVDSLSLNVSQYEELYRLTSKSYQLGKSTMLELLEVQDNLLDSKISLAQNKIQYYTLSQNYLWQAGLQ